MQLCKICGAEIADSVSVCPTCGYVLSDSASETEAVPEQMLVTKHSGNTNTVYKEHKLSSESEQNSDANNTNSFKPASAPVVEPNPTPAVAPAPVPAVRPTSAPSNVPERKPESVTPTSPSFVPADVRICPSCGYHCNIYAVECSHCGMNFITNKPANKQNGLSSLEKNGKIINIIAIVLVALGGLFSVANLTSYESLFLPFLPLIGSILIVVGFVKGNHNKLPAIGYFINSAASVIAVFGFYSGLSVIVNLLSVVQTVYTAMLFYGNSKFMNRWYIPVVIAALTSLIGNVYYGLDNIFYVVFSSIGAAIGSLVICLNAKINWNVTETTEQPPVQ